MAPHYKLTYFNFRGLGDAIRFLLSYMKADWEDNRVAPEDWAQMKDKTPWGKMPILEVDGKQLTQSIAILRYLGKQAGLAGKDDWENAQIDIIADTITDMRLPVGQFFMEKNEEVKKAKKDTWVNETLPFYLGKFEAIAKANKGYLANGKLSWADLLFASLSEFLDAVAEVKLLDAYTNLNLLRQKVFSQPQIAAYLAKRPTSTL